MLFLFFTFLISACATEKVIIMQDDLLPYKDSSQLTKIEGAIKNLKINEVNDRREKTDLGFAYVGVQYTKTPIQLEQTEVEFVRDYMQSSFEARGIDIDESSPNLLDINIYQLYVYEVIEKMQAERAKCHADLELTLFTDSKKWVGRFNTEYLSAGDLSDGTERISPTLASCLNDLVEKIIQDDRFISSISNSK